MANPLATPDLSQLPTELLRHVTEEAERDAGRTGAFLGAVGLGPPDGGVRRLPGDLLLNLGAALRLLSWEQAGLAIHREAGLPAARDAIRQVFLDAVPAAGRESQPGPWLGEAVLRLSVERFAWAGRRELQAEVLLDFPDEDALVEAMARFLWDHRHTPTAEQ
jgi:hypothetical protein